LAGFLPGSLPLTESSWSLSEFLGELSPAIRIVDIGALWLGEGAQVYSPLLRARHASVVGFEPIAEECESLNQRFGPPHLYLPYAVADGTKRLFHHCNFPMTSSLYEPDLAWMNHFHDLARYCQVTSVQELETVRLDDVKEAHGADYLKIDVQGAELDVLRSATAVLQGAAVVQTEVEFVPIYRRQPLFADVDHFLREQGFMFHRFVNMEGRTLQLPETNRDPETPWQQLLWADAVYVRDIFAWDQLASDSLLKLALILHEMYRSFDFSAKLLQMHDERTGSGLYAAYVNALRRQHQRSGE
jgi:FkbM family methyltransferase